MGRRTLSKWISMLFLLVLILPASQALADDHAKDKAWKILLGSIERVSTLDLLNVLIGDSAEQDVPPAMLAHMFYIQRHFDLAAFYFSVDYDLNPENVESLANLAGILVEMNAFDPDRYPTAFVDWALQSARLAADLRPDYAGIQNTRAFVTQLAADVPDFSDELLKEGWSAAKAATEMAPDRAAYWLNLARILDRLDQKEAANQALLTAHAADPDSRAYYMTAEGLGRTPIAPPPATGAQCTVNFKCAEICPKSIIGQINFVSCKLENDTQQKNCKAGKPFATAYNCEEEFPVFGALPGLSSVVSICVPGLCIHIRIKNGNEADVRIEAGPNFGPIKILAGTDGHFSNKNGFSVDRFSTSAKFSLYNRSRAGNLAGKHAEINPLEIKVSDTHGEGQKLSGSAMGHNLIEF